MKTFDNLIIGFGKGGKTLAGSLVNKVKSSAGGKIADDVRRNVHQRRLPADEIAGKQRPPLPPFRAAVHRTGNFHFYQAIEEKRRLTAMFAEKNYDKLIAAGVEVIDGKLRLSTIITSAFS